MTLLVMYVGYCVIMIMNSQLYAVVKKAFGITGDSKMENTAEIDMLGQRRKLITKLGSGMSRFQVVEFTGAKKAYAQMEAHFSDIDATQSLVLDRDEMKKLFQKMGACVTPDDIEEAMQDLDTDHDGVVSFEELKAWFLRSNARLKTRIHELFEEIDTDKDGKIDKEELKAARCSAGR